jgi:mono/diheme cytochrome c family protein
MVSLFRIAGFLFGPAGISVVGIAAILAMNGCDSPPGSFKPDELYAQVVATRQNTDSGQAAADVNRVMESLFGTPDAPKLPDAIPSSLIDRANLSRAAGPVSSDKEDTHFGIYRARCVVCHALDGSGAGPAAALQNPYPRDFRAGVFKYKSTPRSEKPTKADLQAILRHGAPGSSMPAFDRLPQEDLDAAVDYVVYLSIRGEVQRRLIQYAVTEMGYGDQEGPPSDAVTELNETVSQVIESVVDQWMKARPIDVPAMPAWDGEETLAAIERGRELFHGQLANCASCHGANGNGDAVTLDFDDWTKEYTTLLGISPSDKASVKPMRKLGALPPRPISPRNLSWGVYRGGGDPETLYRRLVAGIAGTPMPGLLVQDSEAAVGVTPSQIWDLVAYLRSLGDSQLLVGRRP